MSKLIGTNPNQVPSNADLGTAAFMDAKDFLTSRGSSLSAINAVINKSVSNLFVYDTSNDSDGGAWRKQTHHTSWYNERLNTSTRGSRREFPSVAVIVLEATTRVVIYDADDPTLPMWMVFTAGSGSGSGPSILAACNLSSVCAMNGQIVVTDQGSAAGTYFLNFIPDYTRRIGNSTTAGTTGIKQGGISQRNQPTAYGYDTNPYALRDWYSRCSAITVLGNAPIDSETGLPKTTIAIGTQNDVTIFTQDNTAVDIVGTSQGEYIDSVAFTEDGRIVYCHGYACVYASIPDSDDSAAYYNQTSSYISRISNTTSHAVDGNPYAYGSVVNKVTAMKNDGFAVAGNTSTSGFVLVENIKSSDEYRQAHITQNYNTGWIHGDPNVVVSPENATTKECGELITNSTFDSNTSGWFTVDSNNTITYNSGTMEVTRGGSSYVAGTTLNRVMRAGVKYVIRAYVVQDGGGGNNLIRLGTTNTGYDRDVSGTTGTGYHYVTYTPTVDITSLWIYAYPNLTTIVDDVSVTIAEDDRSRFANDFQVFEYGNGTGAHTGALETTPVAYGSDTQAIKFLTSKKTFLSSYQDKNIGTGDFSVSFWIYPYAQGSGYFHALSRASSPYGNGQSSSTGFTFKFAAQSSNGWIPYFYSGASNDAGTYDGSNYAATIGQWSHIFAQRRAGVFEIYVNGEISKTGSSNAYSITDKFTLIGRGSGSEHGGDCNMALIRHTYDSATPDQIRKMFEDEKHLFKENAKGRIYGDDATVSAMAFDKKHNELQVGTAYGRSAFQGLVRTDYSTNGVTIALSASDGLVAEE